MHHQMPDKVVTDGTAAPQTVLEDAKNEFYETRHF
jgi:hypothetical protein